MKPSHNILSHIIKPWVIHPSGQLFPNSGGVVVAFSNCQLSIVNRTSSTSHPKFSTLNSKFSFSQGFLYAPFGEITTEYAPLWQNGTIPRYAFNAKELDEETGMYYYEARYYKPPVFTSRDSMFEKYFWMTPYAYCANNPVKYVDPSGKYILPKQEAAKSKVFANYVNKQMLSDVMASPTIINALMKYGKFKSDADICAVLTNGYGPQINIVDREKISGANGYYTGVKNGSINIASDLIDLLNNSNGEDREAALFLIVNVLLHETVHYWDWQDGDPRDNQGVFFIDGDVTGILKGDGCGDKGHLFQSEVYLNNQWDKKIETLEEAKQALKEIRKSGVNNDVIPTIP